MSSADKLPLFDSGTPVLYRTVDENQDLTSVLPVRVVEDSASTVSLWLPLGTSSIKPVLHDRSPGSPRRWLPGTWSLEPATWKWAELLIVIPNGRRHATWLRWSPQRQFLGWYVNIQGPLTRTYLGFDHLDQQLDILIEPDHSWHLKDEDELDVAVQLGRIDAADADEVRSEAKRVIADVEHGKPPFTSNWIWWAPPTAWNHPELPDNWADMSMYGR